MENTTRDEREAKRFFPQATVEHFPWNGTRDDDRTIYLGAYHVVIDGTSYAQGRTPAEAWEYFITNHFDELYNGGKS